MGQKPLIVLIAHRDPETVRDLGIALRRRGARVLTASTATQAALRAESFRPDAIVIDDDLCDPAHPDLGATFRSVLPQAELVLLVSAATGTPRGIGLGLLLCVVKPAGTETIVEAILSAFPDRLRREPDPASRGWTVLCVDDDPLFLGALERVLRRHGCKVSTHQDPAAALDAIPDLAPDLAILDIMMPGKDGYQLAREIRSEFAGAIPVVLLSARSSAADYAAGYLHGASFCLSKPYDAQQLLEIVESCAGNPRAGPLRVHETPV